MRITDMRGAHVGDAARRTPSVYQVLKFVAFPLRRYD